MAEHAHNAGCVNTYPDCDYPAEPPHLDELWIAFTDSEPRNPHVLVDTMRDMYGVKEQDALDEMWRLLRRGTLELTNRRWVRRV